MIIIIMIHILSFSMFSGDNMSLWDEKFKQLLLSLPLFDLS